MSKGLHHNVQQTRSTEAIEALRLQLFATQLSHSHANPHRMDAIGSPSEGMISCLLSASVHPLIIIPILKPAVALEQSEKDTAVCILLSHRTPRIQ